MLIVHVGTQKTGSSSIQHFLRENEGLLRESGISYISAVREWSDHNKLARELRSDAADTPRADAVVAEITARGYDKYILSAEELFHKRVPGRLFDHLTRHLDMEVRIVCYLRRPDHLMEALYKQRVKTGDIKPWPLRYLDANKWECDYLPVLDAFADRFGGEHISVRPYARPHLKDGDIVADFLDVTGLRMNGSPTRSMPEDNPTFSSAVSEMMGFCVRNSDIRFYDLNEKIAGLDWPNLKKSGDVYNRTTRLRLLEELEPGLREITRRYGEDLWQTLSFDDLREGGSFAFPSEHDRAELALQAGKAVLFAAMRLKG
ncbi:hypothetical protein [Paenirhodobacter populi]|uniref:Sulfotransferase domain-containing protein n=1 Tax=Paenirhodobacter populi TaxID=2306993 RepID=A0A443JNH9_9RHOB|nr:hypothetical protein [Sinirhodobacter populi]RWR22060.1 hypothetical protein D2T30_06835 [Sinirhodobacter populi]